MLMLGTLGEYFARVLDEVRPRPRYIIERVVPRFVGNIPDDAIMLTQRPQLSDADEVVREAGE